MLGNLFKKKIKLWFKKQYILVIPFQKTWLSLTHFNGSTASLCSLVLYYLSILTKTFKILFFIFF